MRRGLGRSNWLVAVLVLVVITLGAVALSGCGGGDSEATPTTAGGAATTAAAQAGGGQGEAVAKEILAKFDELVGKVAGLANAKPEPAALKPQLDELYASYVPAMTELNGKYLALREADIAEFGTCNTYLGSERGKRVAAKDVTLTEALKYYNLELGDQEIVGLLSSKPVELLDIAVKQN